jgi:hypothetical protein
VRLNIFGGKAERNCGNCGRWLGRYGTRVDSRGDKVGNCGKIPHHTSYPEYWEKPLDGAYTHGDEGWGRLATTADFGCNRWEPS